LSLSDGKKIRTVTLEGDLANSPDLLHQVVDILLRAMDDRTMRERLLAEIPANATKGEREDIECLVDEVLSSCN